MICQNRLTDLLAATQDEIEESGYVQIEDALTFDFGTVTSQLSPEGAIELLNVKMQLAELQSELAEIKSQFRETVRPQIEQDSVIGPCIKDVVKITEEMFGGVEVAVESEPDNPAISSLVFTVRPTGSARELVDMRVEWHAKVRQIPHGSFGDFRLSIVPRE